MVRPSLHRLLLRASAALFAVLVLAAWSSRAEAQYKNAQIGFEGGYMFLGNESALHSHGLLLGLRGGYKASDRWWFTARAAVSFRGEETGSNRTVVLFHLVPVDVRYYFQTDAFRPFVGLTNSFQLLFNQTIETNVMWGPGITAGMEFRLKRDLFLGFQGDAKWLFVFEAPDVPLVTLTTQLIFFL